MKNNYTQFCRNRRKVYARCLCFRLRSQLISEIRALARGSTRARAAKRFGVAEPRLADLLRGNIDEFSRDAPVNMLIRCSRRVRVSDADYTELLAISGWHVRP
jgi:predicted XRE-type DNA-binding protein